MGFLTCLVSDCSKLLCFCFVAVSMLTFLSGCIVINTVLVSNVARVKNIKNVRRCTYYTNVGKAEWQKARKHGLIAYT